jgi:hypothetical protein
MYAMRRSKFVRMLSIFAHGTIFTDAFPGCSPYSNTMIMAIPSVIRLCEKTSFKE